MTLLKPRTLIIAAALVTVQTGAIFAYRAVERRRAVPDVAPGVGIERLDGDLVAGRTEVQAQDRTTVALFERPGRPALVHFWATWCAPCRTELPTLLDYAEETEVRLVLVSVDEDWEVVRHFFEGRVPTSVVLDASGSARRGFRVSTLPDTYVLDAQGRAVARVHGPRDWQSSALRGEFSKLTSRGSGR